jgi:hypothetical protein
LLPGGNNGAMDRLNHTLARLKMDCTSDITNLLDIEIRRSITPVRDVNPRRVLQKGILILIAASLPTLEESGGEDGDSKR